jgi:uncharacterized protein (TIGR00251 family)
MKDWAAQTKDGILIKVHIVPNSSKTQIVGTHGDRLKLKIKAPPVDGKANEEIVSFLSKTLNIKKNQIELMTGQTSKSKNLLIKAFDIDLTLLEQ